MQPLFKCLIVSVCVCISSASIVRAAETRTLRVMLYPFIPDPAGAYLAVVEEFEKRYPDVKLQIVTRPDTYYAKPEDGGLLSGTADVYEVDSVLLTDFRNAGKIQPLSHQFDAAGAALVPFSRELVTSSGQLMGMPHWLCSNFLVFRATDTALSKAGNLKEIESALSDSTPGSHGLVVDYSGKSTLGEMYLDAGMDRYREAEKVLPTVDPGKLDPAVVDDLKRGVALDPPRFGRDTDYHAAAGFYPRQFARGTGRAFVGYSESLYYVLSETMNSCRKEDKCLTDRDLAVGEWASDDAGSQPIAWVDTLVIDASVSGQKRQDAEHFIQFMSDRETYKLLLVPRNGDAPRYLLPAREDLFDDADLKKAAPLYPAFYAHIKNAKPVTAAGLNQKLRDVGKQLDSELPKR